MYKKFTPRFLLISFLLLTASIITVVIMFTVGPKTYKALGQINFNFILLALFLSFFMSYFEVKRVQILCKAFGDYLPFMEGLNAIFAYNFLANITPSAMGGEPVLIYMLTETTNMNTKKASTITIVRGIVLILIIAISGPLILFFNREYLSTSYMKLLFDYVSIIFIFIIGIILYSFYNLHRVRSLLERLIGFFQKYKFFQKHATPQIWIKHIEIWIEEFIACFKYLFRNKKVVLFYTVCYTLLYLLANYSIAYALFRGLNISISFLKVISIQIILYFFLYFMPTPGGSGVAEGGFYLLFSNFIPKHLLGIVIILWRFFIAYLWVILGWLVIIRRFGLKGLQEIKEDVLMP